MSDIELVIKIPEEEYRCVQITGCIGNKTCISNASYNGTPLPKGHGRLIDISEYEKYFNTEITYDDGNHIHSVYTSMISTIIEADKSESEE